MRTALCHRKGNQELARQEFERTEREATTLRGIVDLVQVSGTGANGKDGLDASQAVSVYEHFRELLGVEQ